ncbi:hypothetical protein [Arthrobacter sp. TE12232]
MSPQNGPCCELVGGGAEISNSNKGLGLFRATGIYVGAILGSGALVLPAMAADVAGPASRVPVGLGSP